ncbi:MAG: radical SAM family heme chaperone HemW [Bacilli bacterium]|nr:radical SAM family heme chaperone HemW [Bacilli bacterium]
MGKINSLYVHIPFCARICPYCDFPKVIYRQSWAYDYLNALEQELKARDGGLFSTVYVGGGTPSCLSGAELTRLLSFLRPHLVDGGEFSLEINPETLTMEKAKILSSFGVNRASIGAQSATPKSLKTLGRKHTFEDVRKAVTLLRGQGINNINLDLMYGFPDESDQDVKEDIASFLSLKVPHLSAYSLILEEGTAYHAKKIKPLDDDAQQALFEIIREALIEARYERYEVSNFALPGFRCRHNLTYWKDEPYLAIGLGASGYLGDIRYKNTLNLSSYIKGDHEGEVERLGLSSQLEDFFLTNLRLAEGFDLKTFERRFGFPFLSRYQEAYERCQSRGLLEIKDGRLACTSRGLDFLDLALLELF